MKSSSQSQRCSTDTEEWSTEYNFTYKKLSKSCIFTMSIDIMDPNTMTKNKDKVEPDLELFRDLINKSNDAIFVNDPQTGLFIFVNDKACTSLGYDRQELLKKGIMDIETTFPDNYSWQTHVNELRQRGSIITEGIHKRKNGTTFSVEANISYAVLNTRDYVVTVVCDISERKRADAEIAERGAKLQQIMDTASVGIGLVDKTGHITHANRRMGEMFGYVVEELIGSEYIDLVHSAEREIVRQNMLALLTSKIPAVDLERRYLRKDGSEFWGHLACRRFYDAHGNELGLVGVIIDITEHKTTEEALRESENQFKMLVQHLPIAVGLHDRNNNIKYLNDKFVETYGYTLEDIPNLDAWWPRAYPDETYRREVIATWNKEVEKALREGREIEAMPYNVTCKDGTVRIVEIFGMPIGDDNIAIFNDITERKRAEDEFKVFVDRLTLAKRVASMGIWDWDLSTNTAILDNKMYEIYGWKNEGKPISCDMWTQSVHPEDLPKVWASLQRTINQKVCDAVEFRIIRPDGSIRYIQAAESVVLDSNSEVQRVVGVNYDISERKEAEHRIAESVSFIQTMIEKSPFGIITYNAEGNVVWTNETTARIVGSTIEELKKQNFRQLQSWKMSGLLDAAEKALATGLEQQVNVHFITTVGKEVWLDSHFVPFTFEDQQHMFVLFSDITEGKRAEEEKQKLEEERQKMQKLEAIGILAGGIAHDFNNLLQGIFGYISLAKIKIDQKEQSLAMIEQAENALHMSVNLTTQLLTFAKGGKPIKKNISLRPVIENAVKFALSGSRVDYKISFDEKLWAVEADEGQIGQVIQNVVINAQQAMPEGGTVTITTKNVHAPQKGLPHLLKNGDYVEICVEDSGIGIEKQYLQKIFEPYFTTKGKGSGLGLSTCYSIIKYHGGLIDVASEPGKSTTFFIYLPATEAEIEIKEPPAVCSGVLKRKILVMDDEEMVRNIAGELIRSLGHDVELAEHGGAAIEKYQSAMESGKPFDIVILDLTIRGGMGGKETIEQLLLIDPAVRAIVSSGYSDDDTVSDYHKYGFKSCLTKPYKVANLRDTIMSA